ncbi:hypothetical protein C0J52_08719 [Blattella germanica]|nr:hypothetical protein C0J52_08719 [Blattella germanica]
MYFPVGWPKVLNIPDLYNCKLRQVVCNRDKILFAILTDDCLYIWFCKPCVPIVLHRRTYSSIEEFGTNNLVEWRPDSSMLVVSTYDGYLLFYKLGVIAQQKGLYEQDQIISVTGSITNMVCIRDELMLATARGTVLRYRWDGSQNYDYCLDLRRVPFCTDMQVSKASYRNLGSKYRGCYMCKCQSQIPSYCIWKTEDYPGSPGGVQCIRWTPDGCAMAVSWEDGGLSLWSTFGALLMCTLGWDYGLHVDLVNSNPMKICSMEWSAEGYQLWMVKESEVDYDANGDVIPDSLIQMDFVKMYHERPRDQLSLYGGDDVYSEVGNLMVTSTLTGRLAHYSMGTRKWKLFGNETQEKDFVVTGGLLWWRDHIVMGCYSIVENRDEIRIYPRDTRLDNTFVKVTRVPAQVLLLNTLHDRLISFCANGQISIYSLSVKENHSLSVTLTTLRTETGRHAAKEVESIMLNVSGRLLMVQREQNYRQSDDNSDASLSRREKPHLTEALWLFCGAHGMMVWLPLFPRDGDKSHSFMSKRIMLPFHLRIYPLDSNSPFSLPFCVLERTSQVYLHQILRQLIRRNLGFHAWEIARSCTNLPYFPHSLELLLHEVLEEEATSKEPIPDALLPSVIEFIQEFPVYLQTVVQCARKTEIALWPYLFSAAGKPKDLFQECLARKQLDTAASYLIILQNLEPSTVSRQYATLLLDAALDQCKWELSKELVRFLRAIDPNDVESPRASFILPSKYGVSRGRSFSTTTTPKVQQIETAQQSVSGHHREILRSNSNSGDCSKSVPLRRKKSPSGSAEEFFIDVILQRHARRLLSAHRLSHLGYFAAHLDFHLVAWLGRERDRVARVDDFVAALKQLHMDFTWPYPALHLPVSYYLHRKTSATDSSPSSPTIEDRMKSLSVDVDSPESRIGDSGYMSCTGGQHEPLNMATAVDGAMNYPHSMMMTSEYRSSSIVEAQLMPHLLQEPYLSDNSENRWNDVPSTLALENLSQELANRGSPKSEVKLRYLLQLFMEASCLDWALLISVLLRDAMAVLRTTNAARSADHSAESIQHLKDGLVQSNSGQIVSASSTLSVVERDSRVSEGAASQDRPSIGSRNTDEKSSKSDTVFEGSLSGDRIMERIGSDELRDQMVLEVAKEQAIESSGCIIS